MEVTKEQKQLVIVGVLVVVLVFVMMNSLKPKKKPVPMPSAPPAVEVKTPGVPAAEVQAKPPDKSVSGQKERAEKSAWGRNPFVPSDVKMTEGPEFTLRGVSIGKGKRGYAYINDEVVKKGGIFMGYEIVEIEKDKVLLRKNEQSFYIVFPPEE